MRVAIAGSGKMATAHALAAEELGFSVVAVFNYQNSDSLNIFKQRFRASIAFTDFKEFLEFCKKGADGIVCATPTDTLELYAEKASQVLPTLVEKPLFAHVNNSYYGNSANTRVAYNRRFYQGMQELRLAIAEADSAIQQIMITEPYEPVCDQRFVKSILNNTVHALDLLLFLNNAPNNPPSVEVISNSNRGIIFKLEFSSSKVAVFTILANAPTNHKLQAFVGHRFWSAEPLEKIKVFDELQVDLDAHGNRTYSPIICLEFDSYKSGGSQALRTRCTISQTLYAECLRVWQRYKKPPPPTNWH